MVSTFKLLEDFIYFVGYVINQVGLASILIQMHPPAEFKYGGQQLSH